MQDHKDSKHVKWLAKTKAPPPSPPPEKKAATKNKQTNTPLPFPTNTQKNETNKIIHSKESD